MRARGLAYPPSENEPPDWPAVCLDHKDALAYIAWLNAQVKAAHPASGQSRRALSAAQRSGMGICRPRRDRHIALVGRRHRQRQCQLQWLRQSTGTIACWRRWTPSGPTRSDSMACWATTGTGPQDCWHPSYVDAPTDGSAWTHVEGDCAKHVIRGGAWNNVPIFIRSASRNGAADSGGEYDYSSLAGFRVGQGFTVNSWASWS